MPGIVEGAVQQQAAQQPAQATQKKAITPEAQRVVIAAKKVLAQPDIAKQLVEQMRLAQDPATGIAQATILVMKQLYVKSEGSMPAEAIVPAATAVIVDVAKLGAAAGLFKLTPELVKQAAQIAIQMFTEEVNAKQQQMAQAQPAQAAAQPAVQPAIGV